MRGRRRSEQACPEALCREPPVQCDGYRSREPVAVLVGACVLLAFGRRARSLVLPLRLLGRAAFPRRGLLRLHCHLTWRLQIRSLLLLACLLGHVEGASQALICVDPKQRPCPGEIDRPGLTRAISDISLAIAIVVVGIRLDPVQEV